MNKKIKMNIITEDGYKGYIRYSDAEEQLIIIIPSVIDEDELTKITVVEYCNNQYNPRLLLDNKQTYI